MTRVGFICLLLSCLIAGGCAPDSGDQNVATTGAVSFSVPAGEHSHDQLVRLSTSIAGAAIYVTTDGSEPSATDAQRYRGPIAVAGHGTALTIRAFAQVPGRTPSAVESARYSIRYFEQVTDVVFTPAAGTYARDQTVTLSTPTEGATIFYTLDGSTPSSRSRKYRSPLALAGDGARFDIRAIAYQAGKIDSDVASAGIAIDYAAVDPPTMSPPGGTFDADQLVSLSCATRGAIVHYTVDGSEPSLASPIYQGPIAVRGDESQITIKALAVADGKKASSVAAQPYEIVYAAAEAPKIDPPGGSFASDQMVTLTSDTDEASFHYTLDGTDPTPQSPRYTGPIAVAGPSAEIMLKAIAVRAGKKMSVVHQAVFAIQWPTVADVELSPPGGVYSADQTITMTTSTPGATILYTIGGLESGSPGDVFTGPVHIAGDGTAVLVRARAVKPGMLTSAVTSSAYQIQWATVSVPVISPNGSVYDEDAPPIIALTSATPGAVIRYTTDGSAPGASSPVYGAPFPLSRSGSVRAIATHIGMRDSAERSETFRVTQYLHVSAAADPEEGDGSQVSPFGSLQKAVSSARERGGDFHVRITEGTYVVGGLVLDAHISLFGGYDGSDWSRDVATRETTVTRAGGPAAPLLVVSRDAGESTVVDGIHFDLLADGGDAAVIESEGSPTIRNNEITAAGAGGASLTGIRSLAGDPLLLANTIAVRDVVTAIGIHLAADGHALVFNNVIDTGTAAADENYGIAIGDGSRATIINNTVRFGGAALAVGIGSWSTGLSEVVLDNNIVWSSASTGYCIYQGAGSHTLTSMASNVLFDCSDALFREHDGTALSSITDVNALGFARDNLDFDLTDGLHTYFVDEETDWRLRDGGGSPFERLKIAGVDAWDLFGEEVEDFDGFTRSGDGELGWTPGAFENDL